MKIWFLLSLGASILHHSWMEYSQNETRQRHLQLLAENPGKTLHELAPGSSTNAIAYGITLSGLIFLIWLSGKVTSKMAIVKN